MHTMRRGVPWLLRPTNPTIPFTAVAAGVWLSADPERAGRIRSNALAAVRAGRLAVCALHTIRDYRLAKSWTVEEPAELTELRDLHSHLQLVAGRAERDRVAALSQGDAALATIEQRARSTREEAAELGARLARMSIAHESASNLDARWTVLHELCARRLLQMCLDNGGLYVKLGQHVAQLDYLVPEAYTRTLGGLFQSNRQSNFAEVAAVIEEDLGLPLTHLYASFDPQPIASASLAQVHVATDTTGRKLAVKVQHAGLREAADADLAAVRLAVHVCAYLFPDDFHLSWYVLFPPLVRRTLALHYLHSTCAPQKKPRAYSRSIRLLHPALYPSHPPRQGRR